MVIQKDSCSNQSNQSTNIISIIREMGNTHIHKVANELESLQLIKDHLGLPTEHTVITILFKGKRTRFSVRVI